MQKIDKVLKKIESETAKAHTQTGSSADGRPADTDGLPGETDGGAAHDEGQHGRVSQDLGDPDCPNCHGGGWLRHDLPIDHPDFGEAFACSCRAETLAAERQSQIAAASNAAPLKSMTFETFRVDAAGNSPEGKRSLESAYEASRRFATQPEGWLVLHGGFGCGKTHLAASIVNERLDSGASALFVVVPDLLDHLRAAFAPGGDETYTERFNTVREAPLLVLDDLGTQAPTAWAAETLFQLLNYRYNAELPTVVTTNCAIEDLDGRLRSRLGHWGLVRLYEIKALDYRGGIHPDGDILSSLDLYGDMTFQTWDPRTSEVEAAVAANLTRAFSLAREYATDPSGWLVYTGDHGSGKTHLATAIANQRVADGSTALFVVVPDLLDHLRATFSPTSRVAYDKRFEEIRASTLLVLDDLGTESATPWAREKLYQILNYRYAARLPTVITMSASLKDVDPWLRTRMLDRRRCTVFEVLARAYFGGASQSAPSKRKGRGRRRS